MPKSLAESSARTLLNKILDVVRSAVWVLTLPGQCMRLPSTVIRVNSCSAFSGRMLHTNCAYVMLEPRGTDARGMNVIMLVPVMLEPCSPWASRPNSRAADSSHNFAVFGSLRRSRYSMDFPVAVSMTALARSMVIVGSLFSGRWRMGAEAGKTIALAALLGFLVARCRVRSEIGIVGGKGSCWGFDCCDWFVSPFTLGAASAKMSAS